MRLSLKLPLLRSGIEEGLVCACVRPGCPGGWGATETGTLCLLTYITPSPPCPPLLRGGHFICLFHLFPNEIISTCLDFINPEDSKEMQAAPPPYEYAAARGWEEALEESPARNSTSVGL